MSNNVIANDVIIADNDSLIRGVLRSILENDGFTVMLAADGLEAVDYATRTVARLVVLDFKMPRLDGCSACAQIRRLPSYGDVPIVILTAFDSEIARAAAEQAGATAFITKPFKPIDLLQTVAALLGLRKDDGVMASGLAEPASLVWKRQQEPPPLYGEPVELSEGRRVLNICRR